VRRPVEIIMEIILREDIDKLGARGEVVKVAAGYARNYLLPKRLAVAATEANKKIVEQERQAHLRREAKLKGEAEDLAKIVGNVTVTIAQKAGENDQLFGSVTAKDIAEALEKQNYTIDRRKILLDEPIRQLGEYKVTLRLHREVPVEITVRVVKEE
jgi:large subunit ribosomal protein L9